MSSSKKALVVGINYRGTSNELSGCIDDANNVVSMLLTKGYSQDNIIVMTDDTDLKPTRNAILKALLDLLLSGASKLYFHYSGHGTSIRDTNNDELDGYDEALVPIDFMESGMIIDDEIKGLLCCLTESQSLFCVLDCCHSGSGLDLKYNIFERVGSRQVVLVEDKKETPTRGNCIMLSGCLDNQTSADTYEEGQSQGAMTYGFLKALAEPSIKTYEELIVGIRAILKTKNYSQIPSLSSGKSFNLKSVVSF